MAQREEASPRNTSALKGLLTWRWAITVPPRRVAVKTAHCFVARLAKAAGIRVASRLALRGFDSQRSALPN